MPLSLLFQYGLLLAAVVTAFAISTAVGMLVASLSATPRPLGGAPDEPGLRPRRSDPEGDGAEALEKGV
jgi:hypothetical protein